MKIKEWELSIWDIIAWLGFFWALLYFILKALHVFNSPQLADIITIVSIGFLREDTSPR